MPSGRGSVRGENFWLRLLQPSASLRVQGGLLTTASAQCLRLSERFFSLCMLWLHNYLILIHAGCSQLVEAIRLSVVVLFVYLHDNARENRDRVINQLVPRHFCGGSKVKVVGHAADAVCHCTSMPHLPSH